MVHAAFAVGRLASVCAERVSSARLHVAAGFSAVEAAGWKSPISADAEPLKATLLACSFRSTESTRNIEETIEKRTASAPAPVPYTRARFRSRLPHTRAHSDPAPTPLTLKGTQPLLVGYGVAGFSPPIAVPSPGLTRDSPPVKLGFSHLTTHQIRTLRAQLHSAST